MVIQQQGEDIIWCPACYRWHGHQCLLPPLPCAVLFGIQHKDTPIARGDLPIRLRHSPKGNGLIFQQVAHATGRYIIGKGNLLLLRRKAGDEPGRHPRHGNKQNHDQRGNNRRYTDHRKPPHAQ